MFVLYELDKIALSPSLEKVALCRSGLCAGRRVVLQDYKSWCLWRLGHWPTKLERLWVGKPGGCGSALMILLTPCELKWALVLCLGMHVSDLAHRREHLHRAAAIPTEVEGP